MPFRLRTDAEKWFSEIDGREPIKTKFDLYYFCLLAGLASGRYVDISRQGVTARDIVQDFILDYRPAARLMIGLLLVAELSRSGIAPSERLAVRKLVKQLVEPGSSGLSDEGFRAMNGYASGGYEFLAESRDHRPASPDEFLRDFTVLIGEAFGTRSAD